MVREIRVKIEENYVQQASKPWAAAYIIAGLVLIAIGWWWYYAPVSLTVDSQDLAALSAAANSIDQAITDRTEPVHLSIPDVGVNLPIHQEHLFNPAKWTVDNQGASYLAQSAPPGARGNTVIYGHNWPAIFGPLGQVKAGQKIILQSAADQTYTYQVVDTFKVSPNDVWILDPRLTDTVTIFTCAGFLNKDRLVIRARLQTLAE